MSRFHNVWVLFAIIACNSIAGIDEPNLVMSPTQPKCTLNSDCPGDLQICAFATCSQACRADRDCPAGLRCLTVEDGKACIPGTKANCGGDADCPSDGVCRDGQCRNDCSMDLAACLKDQTCNANGACYGSDPKHDVPIDRVSVAGAGGTAAGTIAQAGGGIGARLAAAAGTGAMVVGSGGVGTGGSDRNGTEIGGAGRGGFALTGQSGGGAAGTSPSGGTLLGGALGTAGTGGTTLGKAGAGGVSGGNAGHSGVGPSAGGAPARECPTDGVVTCVESAARARKRCTAGVLENYEPCASDELCDTTSGKGACAKAIPACIGRKPGEVFCDGQLRKTCGPDLVSVQAADCGSPALCQAGTGPSCGACTNNQYRCTESRLEICNSTHTGFDPFKDCGSAPCSAGAGECTELVCAAAGDRRCNGDRLEACNSTRTDFELVTQCEPGLCDDVGKQCDVCRAGVGSCVSATRRAQCSVDGQAQQATDCPLSTPHCIGNGTCVACTPDTQSADCHAPNDCADAFCSVSSNYACQLNPHGTNSPCHTAGSGNLDGMCTADGKCVECYTSLQCIAPDECHLGQCSAAGVCSYPQRDLDWPCNGGVCSELGTCVLCNKSEQCDAPTCFSPVCSNHTCSKVPISSGIGCGGSNVCDGSGSCVPCVGAGQQTCQQGYVCRSNTCTNGLEYVGWKNSSGATATLNADVMYLKRIPTLQYPGVLSAFGVNGLGTGATIKFALYADNGGVAPTGAPLAQGSALGLVAGARESAAVPNNVTLSAGGSYWIAIKLNSTLTAANALVAGTGVPAGESVSEPYTDPFRTFNGTSIAGSFGTELSVYLRVQDSQ